MRRHGQDPPHTGACRHESMGSVGPPGVPTPPAGRGPRGLGPGPGAGRPLAGLGGARRSAGSSTCYCVECHNGDDKTAGLDLDAISRGGPGAANPEAWEKVVRRLVARQMPPEGAMRPKGRTYDSVVVLARRARSTARPPSIPIPAGPDTFRRLNRTEYQNAIRDLLALDVDASALLPNDESSRGFDNVTVGDLSPTLLDRYITAAQKISRLAVGSPRRSPGGDTFRIRADLTQEEHVEGLPIGTRGGALIPYTFPQDGEYEIQAPAGQGPQRARRGPARAARAGGPARSRADGARSP